MTPTVWVIYCIIVGKTILEMVMLKGVHNSKIDMNFIYNATRNYSANIADILSCLLHQD